MSLAAEIAHWYESFFKPNWGNLGSFAVVEMPAQAPFVPTPLGYAASRAEAIGSMRMMRRPDHPGRFLAVVGPYGIEATRA